MDSANGGMQLAAGGAARIIEGISSMAMLRRAPVLALVADTAAFPASDRAGTIILFLLLSILQASTCLVH